MQWTDCYVLVHSMYYMDHRIWKHHASTILKLVGSYGVLYLTPLVLF